LHHWRRQLGGVRRRPYGSLFFPQLWRCQWSSTAERGARRAAPHAILCIASKRGVDQQAIGAAWAMALGAMYAGASAEEAVRLCVERQDAAGGEAFVERLGT
jgi:hypothetical protein